MRLAPQLNRRSKSLYGEKMPGLPQPLHVLDWKQLSGGDTLRLLATTRLKWLLGRAGRLRRSFIDPKNFRDWNLRPKIRLA